MEINERFKEVRKVLKYTQNEYAELLGVSQPHLSGVENGNDNPSSILIKLVCAKFGVSEQYLVNGEGEMFCEGKNEAKPEKQYQDLPHKILGVIIDESPEGISVGEVKAILRTTQELIEDIKLVFED